MFILSSKWVAFQKIMGNPPKSSILIGFSIINHPFWGTPIFGNTQISIWLLEGLSNLRVGNFQWNVWNPKTQKVPCLCLRNNTGSSSWWSWKTRDHQGILKHTASSLSFHSLHQLLVSSSQKITFPETNSQLAPENGWLEYKGSFPFGARRIVRCVCCWFQEMIWMDRSSGEI